MSKLACIGTRFGWAFTTYDEANWHPLTWLSHALDCQFFGLNPAGHHYTNVLLHALNVWLLFMVLKRATGSVWRSCMVGALFALHPINVESVAWVAERKNLISMLFFLLALGSVSLARDQASNRCVSSRRILVRLRFDVKTAGDFSAVHFVALGLLAFATVQS